MSEIKKIVGINLLILLIYSVAVSPLIEGNDPLGNLIQLALLIAVHFISISLMALFYAGNNSKLSKAYLLSSGVVLLVGFSSCLSTYAM